MSDNVKIYKLGGKSLKAAQDLFNAMKSGTGLTINEFLDKYAGKIKALGMKSPAVNIQVESGALPRAYAHVPVCYTSTSGDFAAYLEIPVDYKGRHFVPLNATLLEDQDIRGLQKIAPLFPFELRKSGVQLPVDFNHEADRYNFMPARFNSAASSSFFDGIGRLKNMICESVLPSYNADHVTLSPSLISDENGRPHLALRATAAGKKLPLRNSSWLSVEPLPNGDYLVKPNVRTAGGMVLRDALGKIPDLADKAQLWALNDIHDRDACVTPPPPPLPLVHLYPKAPWPFPTAPSL